MQGHADGLMCVKKFCFKAEKIDKKKHGVVNRRFGFRKYKNLLHRNRHYPDYQIRVRNNPYPKERSILYVSLEIAL